MAKRPAQEQKYITKGGLKDRWVCSHMTIERLIRNDPNFPPHTCFGKGPTAERRWTIAEIEQYERSKVVAKAVA
jgi:hypothetical protein